MSVSDLAGFAPSAPNTGRGLLSRALHAFCRARLIGVMLQMDARSLRMIGVERHQVETYVDSIMCD